LTPLTAVPAIGFIAGVGTLVDSAEVLVARRALSPAGLYSWEVLGAGRRYLVRGPFAQTLGSVFSYPAVLVLPIWQLVAAAFLLGAWTFPPGPQRVILVVAALSAAVARLLFYMRQQLGLDGADQMLSIALLGCGFGAAFGDTAAGFAFTCYPALQLLLSYLVSGTAKAVSPQWRSGSAIVGITGTIGYGHPGFHRLVSAHPRLALLVCWSVILFECGAPLLVFGGVPGVTLLVLGGLAFHVGVAVIMGLNTFVWAFAATYPAVYLLAQHLPHPLS
jgi:hypothetical protein